MSLARVGPIKRFLLSLAPPSGSGSDAELMKAVPVSMEALAAADTATDETKPMKLVRIEILYTGGHYPASAMFMAQAAASLLYSRKLEGDITGGCLTPAILGSDFIERTRSVNAQYTTEMIEKD
ncbi:hypothetical protein F5Y05DRAFT_122003 [Hypoxylon sp. FL0543]|nr:hypothetical protein F5Y05DRAFT_122003 [Hypoxylon sp. FL0543]